MKLTIPATFDGKVFVPDAPVPGVPAGAVFTLTAELAGPPIAGKPDETPGDFAFLLTVGVDDPDAPTDLAAQHDHYLYGTPKR